MTAHVFDPTPCELGEGPLWHPGRRQLFWFDILSNRLHTHANGVPHHWDFPHHVSAAGWVDDDALIVASETGLHRFDIRTGQTDALSPLEADKPGNRSNDGRADPFGGFWIGTMGKNAEPGAGAIWRYYKGELRRLFAPLTIPNAICFSPDGSTAFFTDTPTREIMLVRLDPRDGWPVGEPDVWLDLRPEGVNPDGAVIDRHGNFWNAQWGASRVAAYSPDGEFLRAVDFPATHTSCPAFGGPTLTTLYCTTARQGIPRSEQEADPAHGQTFAADGTARGQPEHRVLL